VHDCRRGLSDTQGVGRSAGSHQLQYTPKEAVFIHNIGINKQNICFYILDSNKLDLIHPGIKVGSRVLTMARV
jgi:hypothetical protein